MNEYQYIYEVYKEKSFSRAAGNLYISQPALSATVRKIEKQLGYQIFDRSTTALRLTEAGAAYVEAAEKILNIEKHLKRYTDDLTNLQCGKLIVSGTSFFSSYVMPPILKAYQELYPGITLQFEEADSKQLYEQAMRHNIDLIIDGGQYDKEHFDSHLLFKEHIVLGIPRGLHGYESLKDMELTAEEIASGRHLLKETAGIDLSILKSEEFVLLKSGHDLHWRALNLCQERGFVPKSGIHLNQLMTALHVAANELGIVFLTDTFVSKLHLDIPLRYYKIATGHPEYIVRRVFIAHRSNCQMTKAMERFIQLGQEIWSSEIS